MATERLDAEQALARVPEIEARVSTLLARIEGASRLPAGGRVLDIGAAQGLYVAEFRRRGFDAVGVDPWQGAVDAGAEIARRTELETRVVLGTAESLPFDARSFDLLIAFSVLEHVEDIDAVFAEAARVLRPGGGFYFYTTSAICPRQAEIRRFPFFPWYPDALKRRIMEWAVRERPALVNHTKTPAYHWFTAKKVGKIGGAAGFAEFYDRWDMRAFAAAGAGGPVIRLIRSGPAARFAANLFVEDSAYLAIRSPDA